MAEKEEIVGQSTAEEVLSKESTDNQMPLESGDWVDSLKNGDYLYSAGYERNEDGEERVKVLTLKFVEYDKKSVSDANTRMAILTPIVDGKESESVKLPSQNIRVGYFPTKLAAVRAFQSALEHMAEVVRKTADRIEAEDNVQVVKVNESGE